VRVVLAEDSGLLRDALTRLLGDHEIEVAAAVTTVPELLEAYEREQPDVAVIDVRLPAARCSTPRSSGSSSSGIARSTS
jgi:DNA-binding NarL/FixJ family response regulator